MPRSSHPPADVEVKQLAEALRAAVSAFVRHVRESGGDVRTAQADTLDFLESHGPQSIAHLARRRGVKHQSMRLVTAQLEAEGLIERVEESPDLRGYLLAISTKGRRFLRDARSARADRIARLLAARVPRDDFGDLRRAIDILDRLARDDVAGPD